jgi:hypothetical protein
MDFSPRLSLPYLAPQQAQKHVTVNEGLRRLDALVQLRVASRSLAAEPATPGDGDAFILPSGASGGSWSALQQGAIAVFQDGAWAAIAPEEGFLAFVADEGAFVRFAAGAWSAFTAGAAESAPKFGVNTNADATNKFAVKSGAVYLGHDDVTPGSGDCRIAINKNASAKTASLIFQSGASGRAEIGLAGDDNLQIKVSADGAIWTSGVCVMNATARVGVGTPAPIDKLHVSGGNIRASNANASSPRFVAEASDIGGQAYFGWDNGAIAQVGTSTSHAMRVMIANNERARFYVDGGFTIGAPTGGSKGAGTLNAVAVYDDNALLSCYVFDAALDGAIELSKWDGKAVHGDHVGARRFAARIGGAHDPLTLDGYAAHWREKRHLSSMPNEAGFDPTDDKLSAGEWIQRLVETVEIQAVLIETLNRRLKQVEALCA